MTTFAASYLDMRSAFLYWFISLLVVMFSFVASFSQSRRVVPTPTPKEDVERVNTEEIKLNVLAFDEKGSFFPGVTANDLVITENNILHPPSSVRRIPANVLIAMDTGGELRSVKSLEQTRRAALAIVASLKDGDSMALLQYADKPLIVQEWTTDKQQMINSVNKTKFGRRDDFAGALNMARDFLLRNPSDNRHLVLITDGTDSVSGSSAKFDTLQTLLTTDISVHVLSYTAMEAENVNPRTKTVSNTPPPKALPDEVTAQLPNGTRDIATAPKIGPTINVDRKLIRTMKARKADLLRSQDQLEKIADGTNGEFILPDTTDEMVDKAPLISKMIDSAYVVTYVPKIPVNERKGVVERNIEVTSKRNGLIVQARRTLVIDNGK